MLNITKKRLIKCVGENQKIDVLTFYVSQRLMEMDEC